MRNSAGRPVLRYSCAVIERQTHRVTSLTNCVNSQIIDHVFKWPSVKTSSLRQMTSLKESLFSERVLRGDRWPLCRQSQTLTGTQAVQYVQYGQYSTQSMDKKEDSARSSFFTSKFVHYNHSLDFLLNCRRKIILAPLFPARWWVDTRPPESTKPRKCASTMFYCVDQVSADRIVRYFQQCRTYSTQFLLTNCLLAYYPSI